MLRNMAATEARCPSSYISLTRFALAREFVLHFRICCVGMLPALSAGESAAVPVLRSVILSHSA